MRANRVVEIIRRGNTSKIADEMQTFEFDNAVNTCTVAQNAPCNIKNDGTYPAKEGWNEFFGELKFIGNPYAPVDVWIKTATLGGRRRTWVRSTI
jgi:hypothetical protein